MAWKEIHDESIQEVFICGRHFCFFTGAASAVLITCSIDF
jgi:hypothetical protein